MYIFDTNSIRTLQNFYPDNFPSIWEQIDQMIDASEIVSVREVYNEITKQGGIKPFLLDWVNDNKEIFKIPTSDETLFLSNDLFVIPGYRQLIRRKNILSGYPVADPFIIASAVINSGVIVTEENIKNNSNSIPNICNKIDIPCINLEGFMRNEDWKF